MRNNRTMFGKPKHKELANIVKIDSPADARKSTSMLKRRFRHAKSRSEKVAIKRATVNASNRAGAFLSKKDLSASEKSEMRKVKKIYRMAYKGMILD